MNQNGNQSESTNASSKNARRALGRGLKEILSEQSRFDKHFDDLPEHVKAARIGAAILELVDVVETRYQPIIFHSVTAYRSVSNHDTTEQIGQRLNDLERQRRDRDQPKPKRRWYFLFLR